VIIRPGVAVDFAIVEGWLRDAALPVEDLTPDHMNDFLVAVVDARLAGMIGLEQFDKLGLLRSLVIDPAARRSGIGRQLVAALDLKLGYEIMERDLAPNVIRETDEFSSLCPGDAIVMKKSL